MLGVTRFQAVIDPDQAAILTAGAARQELARRDGELVERSRMAVAVSADHRVVDGAAAARFLADVRALLERPERLLENGG